VRDIAAHSKHVPIEELGVVDSTRPQRCQRHLHDLLCQILRFRYTAKMPQPVQARALPKPAAKLGFGGGSRPPAFLDAPSQLRIAGVLRCHWRSLLDLFL
jgi:hypothetical protein